VPTTEKPEWDDQEAEMNSVLKTREDVYLASKLESTRKFYRALHAVFDFRGKDNF